MDKENNRNDLLLPTEYRTDSNNDDRERRILDYLGGMMDTYEKHFGKLPENYSLL